MRRREGVDALRRQSESCECHDVAPFRIAAGAFSGTMSVEAWSFVEGLAGRAVVAEIFNYGLEDSEVGGGEHAGHG